MILRRFASPLLLLLALPILLSLSGCNSLKEIAILPAAGTELLTAVGQTAQFTAYGQSEMGNAQPTTANITTSVAWSVTNPSVATINPTTGLATAVGNGYTEVIAQSNGIVATSDLTVDVVASGSGGTSAPSITITPASATETFVGETTQFLANGSLTGGTSQNLTNVVQWISSNVQVATIGANTGLATATGGGTTTITAQSGGVNASVTLTVAVSGTSGTPTLTIIPNAGATATFAGETTQFIALGSLNGSAITSNLTSNVVWSSSDVAVATIDQSGLSVAVAANTSIAESTTITAIGTTSTGSLITATATLTVEPGNGTVNLPELAIYETGTATGTVTSSPGNIDCGVATGSCSGTYPLSTLPSGPVVTLTATPATGAIFGGWSSNCTLVAGNPLQCTIQMRNNETVGAIFNP